MSENIDRYLKDKVETQQFEDKLFDRQMDLKANT
jgi:hypothetical protein